MVLQLDEFIEGEEPPIPMLITTAVAAFNYIVLILFNLYSASTRQEYEYAPRLTCDQLELYRYTFLLSQPITEFSTSCPSPSESTNCQLDQFRSEPRLESENMTPTADCKMSSEDPNSFSNPDDIYVNHHDIRWTVDFERKVLQGSVTYKLNWINKTVNVLRLDTRDLEIKAITDSKTGKNLSYQLGDSYLTFGRPLAIELIPNQESGNEFQISIEYVTQPSCSALQWLDKEQTSGKQHPYMFSQCQPFHARSLLPCQDTPYVKSTYTAEVTAPSPLTVLMSAVREQSTEAERQLFKFKQAIPIPSYLLAIVTGKLASKVIGPRTTVWSEADYVEPAAIDFADTEKFIQIAENLAGEYVWGTYDLLVLPPSFPYGGMENPCLTFVTPTLLAGDKSLANVVAHEISHSWTGNLVTNKNWEHFWLNEGFTVFLERKIIGRMYGEEFRQFKSIGGYSTLQETINKTLGADNPFTGLVLNLTGVDPDDSFSSVPYEKGYLFLYYLEELVGGPSVFEPFFKEYIQAHKYKSIGTPVFQAFFTDYFTKQGKGDVIKAIDWQTWLYSLGMPAYRPKYDTTLSDVCTALVKKWEEWDADKVPCPFVAADLDQFELKSHQLEEFLEQILFAEKPLSLAKVKAMAQAYKLNTVKNSEILFRWLRICIKAKWAEEVPLAVKFITEQNRMKFIRPIYRDLYAIEEFRDIALDTFKKNRGSMMHVAAHTVAKDLGLSK